MKLEIEIDGQPGNAEFTTSNGSAVITYRDETYHGEISEPEPGIFVVLIDDRVYRCVMVRSVNQATEIAVNGIGFSIKILDRKHLSGRSSGSSGQGRASLRAPMPGKVISIMLNAGDEVATNQGIMVVEAMKMQNEVQSPKDGTISEICVSEGQTVNAGDVLAVID